MATRSKFVNLAMAPLLGVCLRVLMMIQKKQLDRFKEAARELECDEDEKRFDATVKKLAKTGDKNEEPKKD